MDRWPPRPRLSASFFKAHGLGNDYLVFEAGHDWTPTPENVRRVCDRYRGVGSDGIVATTGHGFGEGSGRLDLRMFNPDGGEFERSGNGLRVLASYVATRRPGVSTVDVGVGGHDVRMTVHGRSGSAYDISVAMGKASVGPDAIALRAGAVDASGRIAGPHGEALAVTPVWVGNPHLVVASDEASGPFEEDTLATLGPFLATHPGLEHGANVQLARLANGRTCEALIWERGVGRTSASGTSSCAVAVAAVVTGLLDPGEVEVRMPGGTLAVTVGADLDVVLRGPVEVVLEGRLREELLATFEPGP